MCIQFKSCFVLSALTLSLSQYAIADNAPPKEETLVVTTTRSATSLWNSPATIQVIDKETLSQSNSSSIADQLRDIPEIGRAHV